MFPFPNVGLDSRPHSTGSSTPVPRSLVVQLYVRMEKAHWVYCCAVLLCFRFNSVGVGC